jgi:hypothetical protein
MQVLCFLEMGAGSDTTTFIVTKDTMGGKIGMKNLLSANSGVS